MAGALRGDNAEAMLLRLGVGRRGPPGLLEQARAAARCYINELEDLGAGAQRLLLAASSGQFQRVGGSAPVPFDARVDLLGAARLRARGAEPFRVDLLAHLNVLVLRIPPLREYAEDVPELLRYYVDRLVDDEGLPFRRFSVAAQNRLRNYPWPDNVRELKNLVQRLLIQGGREEIRLEEIEREIAAAGAGRRAAGEAGPARAAAARSARAVRARLPQQQLQLCNGKVGQLAKRVGMERTHLYRKLRSLGVDFRQSED